MQQGSIFEDQANEPLASRLRPENLDQVFGQTHLLGPGKILRELITQDRVTSMILWGPPGVGKTTLAQVIAKQTKAGFISFSAVTSGIKEIKKIMQEAEANTAYGQKTIVFVDEIHRFNKAQQDAFLPFVENGSIVLIGATTENPSFEINSALLSRLKVFVLKQLTKEQLVELLDRACREGFEKELTASKTLLEQIAIFSDGDARNALNTLEMLVDNGNVSQDGTLELSDDLLSQVLGEKTLKYDKNGEDHYDLISALHKSMRNSDVDAAIYWLNRMLAGGEDPLYIARRLLRFASEDIGLADNNALNLVVNVFQTCQFIGMPECNVHLTQAVIYLSLAPKSNAVYKATTRVAKDVKQTLNEPVPLQIRNGTTKLMKELGYGKGYELAHFAKDKLTTMQTMPDNLVGHTYYLPTEQGNEIRFKQRLEQIKAWHQQHDKA
ncbi:MULTISPECIES: replication-associated recombination protein A [Ligilactobacillus]|uniref:DNA polymerase III, subunit gamma and tau, dnaX n=1 Tax=Ligilactobacillus animalis TaxID=1605 RepID=A0ABR4RRA9_9LACO|nr:replication-associated recombination protein A [Ligilactobacillus animalis]EOA07609.1 DNA polymerase III, subunit gamma and tau, dnaX [Pediococcus acidilactici D3]KDA46498.1 DNA polymerase III, subunit gamma and tau, dnaX [Ligilactobacillus animalis]MDU1487639.1 replication-associated recombination protein A [Ligilactobacillus animalis]MDU3187403.1 replication-associated recombination protein A [Ligilactobacillus animalis]MEE0260597.1 replication-associated recombination protein A [Ligilact